MAKETLRDRLIKLLESEGWVREASKSRKYVTLTHPDRDSKLFVGRAGAVRKGKSISGSTSVSEYYHRRVQ